MSPIVLTCLMIAVGSLVLLGGLVLVRRRVPLEVLEKQHEVGGFLYSVLGAAYSVLLAFVVVAVWEELKQAEDQAQAEAAELVHTGRLAHALPEPLGHELLERLREYARSVIDAEWGTLGSGEPHPETRRRFDTLWKTALAFRPSNDGEAVIYGALCESLGEAGDQRSARLLSARRVLPGLLWVVLGLGAVVSIVFTFFFGLKSVRVQLVMTVAITLTLGLSLFLVASLDRPFDPPLSLRPDAFQEALQHLEQLKD